MGGGEEDPSTEQCYTRVCERHRARGSLRQWLMTPITDNIPREKPQA